MPNDPYKYFRIEADELATNLSETLLALEKSAGDKEIVQRMLRYAHTLKGAARVVKLTDIADLAHQMEDALAPHREKEQPLAKETLSRLLACVDAIAQKIGALHGAQKAPEKNAENRETPKEDATKRVEISELDALVESVNEALVQLKARDLGQLQIELLQLRDVANRLRMQRVDAIFPLLERVARDAAEQQGKQVEFTAHGGEHRLDAHVLSAIGEALQHAVRNAVAHGIVHAGRVDISVERQGAAMIFVCRDDGKGIDVAAVQNAARARGHRETLDADSAAKLLLQGGLSTQNAVDQVAGRGIGLDVVRETARRLKGEVSLHSAPGKGTTLRLSVPVVLSQLQALIIETGDGQVALPLHAVQGTLRFEKNRISRSGNKETFTNDDFSLPFLPLSRALGRTAVELRCIVVVQHGALAAAIGVQGVRGMESVVFRAPPKSAHAEAVIAGAAIDEEGHPLLVLEPEALIRKAQESAAAPLAPQKKPPPILVVDDSLTTRMLEQSILQTAGYEVDLATSAEDGLVQAKKRRYGLFLVDVEMPKMDGFSFVAHTQEDAELRHVPAILVTSRNGPEDFQRAKEVGARGYVVKGEFDQKFLLDTIRNLVR